MAHYLAAATDSVLGVVFTILALSAFRAAAAIWATAEIAGHHCSQPKVARSRSCARVQ